MFSEILKKITTNLKGYKNFIPWWSDFSYVDMSHNKLFTKTLVLLIMRI